MSQESRRTWTIVAALLALSTLLKLYHLTAPALDWQSWNQVSTLATARYLYRDGLSALWIPRVDLFTGMNIDSNKTFAEFPVIHLLMAGVYPFIGGEAEWVCRVWNIAFSLMGGIYLVRLARRDLSPFAVIVVAALYALSPTNLYFHRTLKTDIGFTTFMVVGLFYFVTWLDSGKLRDAIRAGIAIALAALFKAFALYMGAAFLYLLVRRKGWRALFTPQALLIAAICVGPIALWIVHGSLTIADKAGEGRNLVSGLDLLGPWSLLLRPRYYVNLLAIWFYWTITPFMFLAMATGVFVVLRTAWRRRSDPAVARQIHWPDWLTAWWLGMLVYVIMVRHGNWQHDYYQIPSLEPLCITAALGIEYVWSRLVRQQPAGIARWTRPAILVVVLLSIAYSVFNARGKTALDIDDLYAGKALEAARKPGEFVIYWDVGGLRHNQLLYYSGGPGWRMEAQPATWDSVKPYYDLGARYAAVDLSAVDWNNGRQPVPSVQQLVTAHHFELLSESQAQLDRYGRPRHWAIYRIAP